MTDPDATLWRGFASDNYAGVHPEVLAAMTAANAGHQTSYGDDDVTARLREVIRGHFGPTAEVFPVFNGTGANVVALQATARRWESIICPSTAHVNMDEGGAPEVMAGLKLWTIPTPDGKLTTDLIDTEAWGFGVVHRSQPGVVSVTQSTEYGTAYTPAELSTLADHVHRLGMRFHVDGARLANAAASLGCTLAEAAVGADVISLGATKNGGMMSEAVVVLDPAAAPGVDFLRKTSMQLASKMRFISAQLLALFEGDLWRRNAEHANAMAQLLASRVRHLDGVRITQAVEANAVFAVLDPDVTTRLQQEHRFYTWNEHTGEVRWMCAWDTTVDDIDRFVAAIEASLAS